MPHPKRHLKLTGDTHPPEVEDDLSLEEGDDEPAEQQPLRATAMPRALGYDNGPEDQQSRIQAPPLLVAGLAALGVVWLLRRLLRR